MTLCQTITIARRQLADKYPEREIESLVRILVKHYAPAFGGICNAAVHPAAEQQILSAVDELKKYRPIQYILGETEFYRLQFEVNPDVLIPRPETEELVDWIVRGYDKNAALTIVDIGAGSGCIAVALKVNFPNATAWAVDVSEKALSVAQRNAEKNNVEINCLKKDALKDGMMGFEANSIDIIVSNPPYVTPSEKQYMMPNVLDYEPHCALFVPENDPLIFYKHIAAFGKESLKKGGKIFFEINEAYPEEVAEILKQQGFSDVAPRKDINDKWRMVAGGNL